MTAANASAYLPEMNTIVSNSGGAIASLNPVTKTAGRVRNFATTLALASQTNGTTLGVARIPLPAMVTRITMLTDTSLGSSTVALGDASDTAKFKAAATFTATDTPTSVGKQSALATVIYSGYDCQSGAAKNGYTDITMTIGAANLPSSGNFTLMIEYVND